MEEKTLGPYELIRLLGKGGMGEVYLARDPRLGRQVALKILSAELAAHGDRRERFLREARAVSALNHPNICTIHEIGSAGGQDYICFEHIEGQTLQGLTGGRGLPPEPLLSLALPLADALEYAHRKGVIHRDLKPSNVMVSDLGVPKILDFGLAKIAPPPDAGSQAPTRTQQTDPGMVLGTVAYMSPEQALGRTVDARSDIFSFGILLYEAATGRQAFTGATPTEVLDAVIHKEPVPLERIRPDLPLELARVVEKALRKDPAERYQHMADLAADLRHLKRESGARASGAVATPVMTPRMLWSATAAVVVIALAGWLVLYRMGADSSGLAPAPGSSGETGTGRAASGVASGVAGDSLAVMYFENLSDRADTASLGRMLTGLLSTELTGTEGLHVVSSQRLYDIAKQLGRAEGALDRSDATTVASRAGVARMVLGQVVQAGGKIVATTEVVEVASGRSLASQKAEGKSDADVFSIAEALGEQVRQALQRPAPAGGETAPLARQLTGSVEAYRAFVRGEVLYQRMDFAKAVEQFREAVRIDPDFALAYYRLSLAGTWFQTDPRAPEHAKRALALKERLPPEYREIVEANSYYIADDPRARPILESVLARDPQNKEALYLLSEIYIHSSSTNNPARAAELMEQILALDPDFHLVHHHLAFAYELQGRLDKVGELIQKWETADPELTRLIRAEMAGRENRPEEALRLSEGRTSLLLQLATPGYAMLASRWEVVERLLSRQPPEGSPPGWRNDNLGLLHAYRGKFNSAMEEHRLSSSLSTVPLGDGMTGGKAAQNLFSVAGLLVLKGDLKSARAEAERALSIQPSSPRGLAYAGVLAVRGGDLPGATRYLQRIEEIVAIGRHASADLYRDALEAEIVLSRGRAGEARRLFERVIASGRLNLDSYATDASAGAAFRDGLARACLALGDKQGAAQALEGLLSSGSKRLSYPLLYVRALYTLGVLKLDMGDEAAGREYLKKFLDHWGNADWDLAEVRDARKRLAATQARSGGSR